MKYRIKIFVFFFQIMNLFHSNNQYLFIKRSFLIENSSISYTQASSRCHNPDSSQMAYVPPFTSYRSLPAAKSPGTPLTTKSLPSPHRPEYSECLAKVRCGQRVFNSWSAAHATQCCRRSDIHQQVHNVSLCGGQLARNWQRESAQCVQSVILIRNLIIKTKVAILLILLQKLL